MNHLPQLIKTSLFVQNFCLIKKYRTFFLSITVCLSISPIAFYSCKTNANDGRSTGDVGERATVNTGDGQIETGPGAVIKYERKNHNTNSSTKNETQIGTVHQPPQSNPELIKVWEKESDRNEKLHGVIYAQKDTIYDLKNTNKYLRDSIAKLNRRLAWSNSK